MQQPYPVTASRAIPSRTTGDYPKSRSRRKKPWTPYPAPAAGKAGQGAGFPLRKDPAGNILFRYLYRDASNYKQHGEAIFSNHTFLPPDEIERRIRACLEDGKFFIARQVRLEERFFETLYEDDHPWHEFEGLESTTLAAFDPDNWSRTGHRRDVTEFLADLEAAHRVGWDETRITRQECRRIVARHEAALRLNREGAGDE